jgi:aldose sugar dehydrogenase
MVTSESFSIKHISSVVIVLLTILMLGGIIIHAPLMPLLSYASQSYAQLLPFMPSVKDQNFVVEEFIPHLSQPTSIAFVNDSSNNNNNNNNNNDLALLILQKNDGTVRVARNGSLSDRPVLDVNVANEGEQGMMLGITTVGNDTVYLYSTESSRDGGEAISKHVYQYTWNNEELVESVLVRDLPATQTYHNGGAMTTGPDGVAYLAVGDTGRYGILQNNPGGGLYPILVL